MVFHFKKIHFQCTKFIICITVFIFIIVNHSNLPLRFLSSFVSGYLKLAKSMMIS